MKAAIIIGLVVLILSVGNVKAQDSQLDQPYPVNIKVGEIYSVCKSGLVVCPVRMPVCDDSSIIMFVDTQDGFGFKGVAPGTTLCSVSTVGPRRFFRITVH